MDRRSRCILGILMIATISGCVDEPTTPGGGMGTLMLQPRFNTSAPPPLDVIDVTLSGPTDTTVTLTRSGGFFEGTINGLAAGSYNILLLGRASGQVTYFGQTSGVQVTVGETADANVPFNGFVPEFSPTSPTTTAFRFPVVFSNVPDATEYFIEGARDLDFTNAATATLADTTDLATVDAIGTVYLRVRAGNGTVPAADAAPSEVLTVTVRADFLGNNDPSRAISLGSGFEINGSIGGNHNITPIDEEDWYRFTNPTAGRILVARVRTQSLDPSSLLDPIIDIRDAAQNVVATNDNLNGNTRDAGVTIALAQTGTHFIVIRAAAGSAFGRYELETFLTSTDPVATVTFDPPTAALQPGETFTLEPILRDANGVQLFMRNIAWSSSASSVASVDANGMVAANANGTATITATSEGVDGAATVTVSDAVPAVASIVFVPGGVRTEVGGQTSMRAEARAADGQLIPNAALTLSSLNSAVASVSPGGGVDQAMIAGTGIGQTAIVAQSNGAIGYGLVTVTQSGLEPLRRWSPLQSGTTENLYGVWAAADDDLHAVGNIGVQRRFNGSSWVDEALGSAAILYTVFGLGPDDAWAAGLAPADADNGVLQFNGANWSFLGSAPALGTRGLWAANPRAIFMAAQNTASMARYDGDSWNTDVIPGSANGHRAVWGTRADNVWAVGFTGEIVQFDGAAWSVSPTGQSDNLHGVWGSGPANIVAVGTGPEAWHYDGAAWIPQLLPVTGTLNAVWGRAPNDVYAVGDGGLIMHYDGAQWSLQHSGTTVPLYSIAGTPGGDVYIVGGGGTILKGRVPEPLILADVAAGYQLGCAVTEDGTPYCWGDDSFGQLGNGDPLAADSIPRAVSGGLSFTQIVTSGGGETGQGYHACGLTDNGLAYCWGRDLFGQLGDGTSGDQASEPTLVTGGHIFTKLTAGFTHTCGLDANQVAWCWGDNQRGELGNGESGTGVMSATPVRVAGSIAWLDISAGHEHTCGIAETDGAGYCWGYNAYGQLGDQTETQRTVPTAVFGGRAFIDIAAGDRHTCAIDRSNDPWCWGWNDNGQLGVISQPDQCLGTLACELTPVSVNTAENFTMISAGNRFTCGVNPSGVGFCWGQNTNGSLGTGNPNDQSSPTTVAGGLTFSVIRAGRDNACGLTTNGRGYCWGTNASGELGNGSTASSNVPVLIFDP